MIFRKNKKRKIDFLIIGTQKGGTSAIDYYLRQHPDIGMGKKKELHFFDNEEIFSRNKIDYSIYESQFDLAARKKIYGEATPIYIFWEPSCRRIHAYNSDIKLIAILRNPIERAFSNWNMEYDRNAEKEDFLFCIKNETKRVQKALPLQHRIHSYVSRGLYAEQIKRYKRYFTENQILFIKYEDFRKNQEKELIKLLDFLGVSSEKFTFEKKILHKRKQHKVMTSEEKTYLINKFEEDIHEVEKLLGWDCKDWLSS